MKTMLVLSVFLSAAAVVYSADNGTFLYKVGDIDIYTLVENTGQGRPSILIGDRSVIDRYIPGGGYKSATNTFLVKGPDGVVIIDTGFGRAIFDHIKGLGVKPEDVTAVLLTHTHGDHTGGLARDGKPLFPRAALYISGPEFDWASNATKALISAYGSKVEVFKPGTLEAPNRILPGIGAAASFGHTPGHTAYLIESAGKRLLVWGDLMHAQDVQFPAPGIAVTYDSDAAAATAARKVVLAWAAANKVPVAGHHLVYPAMGHVEKQGTGYRFVEMKE
jgi:glyoxylase-like metal-dependent hydrolase (beta-lactamase superfamily II)